MSKPKRIKGKQKVTIKKAVKPNYNIAKTTFYKNGKAVKKSSANAAFSRNTKTSAASAAPSAKKPQTRTVNNPNAAVYRQGKAVSIGGNTPSVNNSANPAQKKISISKSVDNQKNILKKPDISKQPAKYKAKITAHPQSKAVSVKGNTPPVNGSATPAQKKISISKSAANKKRVLKKPVVSKQPVKYKVTADVSLKLAAVAKRNAARRIFRAKAKKSAKNAAKCLGKRAAQTVLVTAPISIAQAKAQAKRTAAETMINQGLQSTGFNNDVSSSPNAQAAETFSRGFKDISEHTISTARNAPRKLIRSVQQTNKNIRHLQKNIQGVQCAAKGMNQAVKNFQKAQHINSIMAKGTKKSAATTAKNVVKLTVEMVKQTVLMIIRAVKTAVACFSAFIWIAVAVILVVIIVFMTGSILFSEYGIFVSNDSGSSMTIQDVIKEVNLDYQTKIDDKISELDNSSVDLIRYEGYRTQWKNIIAIYSVKYASDEGDVITVDNKTVNKVKGIFYKFHSIRGFYVNEPSPYDSSKQWRVLVIQTNTATPEEIMDEYKFTEEQRKRVNEIITSQPDDLWNELIYGTSGGDTAFFLEILKQQLGQYRSLYTAWYGESSIGDEEWGGCFVSWCANEAGFITKGYYPKFKNLNDGINWFKSKGLWQNSNEVPAVGDTIFLDWHSDGNCDRCGIITDIKDGNIYYIGANVTDEKVENSSVVATDPNHYIMGFGKLSLTP